MLFSTVTLTLALALALCTSAQEKKPQIFATFREDLAAILKDLETVPEDLTNYVEVLQVESDEKEVPDDAISQANLEIMVDNLDGSSFKGKFGCVKKDETLSFSDSKKWVACCPKDKKPSGSEGTAFRCCGYCESLVGAPNIGYKCCGQGLVWDGGANCKSTICEPGEVPFNGKCICPHGWARAKDGKTCEETSNVEKIEKCRLPPSVQYGKPVTVLRYLTVANLHPGQCYTFTFDPIGRFNYLDILDSYVNSPETSELEPSIFQLCKNEECGPDGDVGPTDRFPIKDVSNQWPGSELRNEWLTVDEDMIVKTSDYEDKDTRLFTIMKSAAGKQCLGSADTDITTKSQGKYELARFTAPGEHKSCLSMTKVDCPSVREHKSNLGSPAEHATPREEL